MATVTLRDATSGIRPEFELEIEPQRQSVDTPDGAGAAFSRQINERSERRWRFVWSRGTEGHRHVLETKWAESGRGALPMDYLTEDGSETVEVKFVKDSLRIRQTGPTTYQMSVEAQELRSRQLASIGGYNVIVFLVDDAGREYYECYDNATYSGTPIPSHWANQWGAGTFAYPPTPALQALANNGLLLSRMNVAAMCSPTRASLLTGRHNSKHTLGNAIQGQNQPAFGFEGTTIYQLLEAQGSNYVRAHLGKWHISNSYQHWIEGMSTGLANTTRAFRSPVDDGRATYYFGGLMNFGTQVPGLYEVTGQSHAANENVVAEHDVRDGTDSFTLAVSAKNALIRETEKAVGVITDAAAADQPFLLMMQYHAVHDPTGWDEIGGADLHSRSMHSYGASNPGGAIAGDVSHPGIVKAFIESTDTSVGQIVASLSADQASKTMIVFITDNGSTSDMLTPNATADVLEPGKDTVPTSTYDSSHSKRSPWQGGIGAACVINGPAVADPGDGSTPRVWNGLCGIEDLNHLICEWTGAFLPEDERYGTGVLRGAIDNTSATGRDVYFQRAFQNGYHNDMFSTAQGSSIRSLSVQNADGWKLIWLYGGSYTGDAWLLYDMTTNPQEADTPNSPTHEGDIFGQASGGTIQAKYEDLDNVQSGAQAAFEQLYSAVADESLVPPGMAVSF